MNRCKEVNVLGGALTAIKAAQTVCGHSRRKTLSRPVVLAQVTGRANLGATSATSADSRDPPASATGSANPTRFQVLFETKSGLDITQQVLELLWLAAERNHPTFEMVQEPFAGDSLTPDDLAAIRRTLGQAGVELVGPPGVEPVQSPAHTVAEESVHSKTRSGSVQNYAQQTGEVRPGPSQAKATPIKGMEDADHEMRQILYSFGFAAHEHVARAEKLLAHPSTESVEHWVADSEIRGCSQYFRILPNLVKEVRALDQKASAVYRMWRQALGQPNSEEHRTEFRRLDRELQQTFPRFCYRAKAIQEMSATAQSIAAKFRASQRVLQQARRRRDSVCQMPVLDVERQTIEAMEEFVRMPCEVFLRNCTQLKTAETRFQQARGELIQGHLPLVASIAATCSNQDHTLAELIRGGIFGLIRAVDKFGYRRERKFSAYAAGSIRQGVRHALAAQPRHVPRPAPPAVDEGDKGSSESVAGTQDVNPKPAAVPQAERQQDEKGSF